ncbi:cytidylyltransferase domain-containing protein [Flagellimonas oceanensis]|uniref:cytidylyltransferase domain-containing protein n=1 Tax=Flagellimonas oceanensis TaxID=2499163 RepID=UPI000F8C8C60|nr:hypothetical protein [Allomuricauda oceanensis]
MTGIIILCRFNSSRLPGKILKKINGKTILEYIIERLSPLKNDYPIVVCTSAEISDDPIEKFCQDKGWEVYRGSLENVAERFKNCANQYGFSSAVRINGDNIFVDPELVKKIIQEHELGGYLFSSNVKDRTFPKGMSVEVVNINYYEKKYPFFTESDCEHVMTYFYKIEEDMHKFHYNTVNYGKTLNFAIDTQEDFERASNVIDKMNPRDIFIGFEEILELYNKINEEK